LRWTVRNGPCQTSDEVQVRFDARPLALAGPDRTNLCGVTSVYLAANIPPAPATGQWEVIGGSGGSFSNAADPGTAFTGLLQQHYTLRWTVRNGACLEEKDEVQVRFNPIPSVDAGPDGEITAGETWPLKASGDGLYAWTPATGLSNPAVADPLAAPTQSTTYVLTLTSAAGCTAVDSVFVKVYPRLEIPTAFSPNGDGTHDVWSIPGFKEYSQARLDVFDRLGNKVFSGDHTSAWNGTHKGQSLPMDTYFYVIHPNNGKKPIVGSISIIK
jgi:gliding motility-associated-like protein